ncbi:MAG: SDR family NAD(P)-dependent oxidoreductase, partial [Bacteroidia bacterium]
MQKSNPKRKLFKDQEQNRPGLEYKMEPPPQYESRLPGANKLENKVCVVTGGDSGIGRAVAIAFAKEGADVAIIYLSEDKDAEVTAKIITKTYSRKCLLVPADISGEKACDKAI